MHFTVLRTRGSSALCERLVLVEQFLGSLWHANLLKSGFDQGTEL